MQIFSVFLMGSLMKNSNSKIRVGILGATGMVGQRLISLLENHPWFEVVCVAASAHSAGKNYAEAVAGRWAQQTPIPKKLGTLKVYSVEHDVKKIAAKVSFVFSAIEAENDYIKQIEELYAASDMPVVSNNAAHRWTADVPMIMPEINPDHLRMIEIQRKNRGWKKGLIITKPNCSIQCYVPLLQAWQQFEPQAVVVSTYQAISGAGKTFATWPEMVDNVIPYIGGEEKKSEQEPAKILAKISNNAFELAETPTISANCIRVPVSDGHLAAINIRFNKAVDKAALVKALNEFNNPLSALQLPSAPEPFITYFEEDNRPQTRLDRDLLGGMGISVGRIRKDPVLGWKCVALSHNTLRGAAGGSVLSAELLLKQGYLS